MKAHLDSRVVQSTGRLVGRWALLVAVAASVLGTSTGPAVARARPNTSPKARTYRLAFRRAARNSFVFAAGDHAVLAPEVDAVPTGGQLLDERTGQRVPVGAPAGCGVDALAPSAIVFVCRPPQPGTVIRRLDDGRIIPAATAIGASVERVGRDWLQYAIRRDEMEHSAPSRGFLSLRDGTFETDPAHIGGSIFADPDTPRLAQALCLPIRQRGAYDSNSRGDVATDVHRYGRTLVFSTDDPARIAIQHCGSRQVRNIRTGRAAFGGRAVVWLAGPDRVDGIDPTTGMSFHIPLPPRVQFGGATSVLVDARAIYVSSATYLNVWRAALPPVLATS